MVVLFIFRMVSLSLVKLFWKLINRYTLMYVTMVVLNPLMLTMNINCNNSIPFYLRSENMTLNCNILLLTPKVSFSSPNVKCI